MLKTFLIFLILFNFIFANVKMDNINNDINKTKIIINKKNIKKIFLYKKEANKIKKELNNPIYIFGFSFKTKQSKQLLYQINQKFKQCLKDKKYVKNPRFCYDLRRKEIYKLAEYESKNYWNYLNKLKRYEKYDRVLLRSAITLSPTYQKYRKLRLKCMNLGKIDKIKKCFKDNDKELKYLSNKLRIIKKILNKEIIKKEKEVKVEFLKIKDKTKNSIEKHLP